MMDPDDTITAQVTYSCFIPFRSDIEHIDLPSKFTFPFCYEPSLIAALAAEELQQYYLSSPDLTHDFGLNDEPTGLGKMFGVLVVKNPEGKLGYLAAFSGKLHGGNHYAGFVPPVFDTLDTKGFYKKGEEEINVITRKIENLEQETAYKEVLALMQEKKAQAAKALIDLKAEIKDAKAIRKQKRLDANVLSISEQEKIDEALNLESIALHFKLKEHNKYWNKRLAEIQLDMDQYLDVIQKLKDERKQKSGHLQHILFHQYTFLNQYGQQKSLLDIFEITDEITPPSGAGECAAPKLLQHAFQHGYRPVAMAEFWWGKSPASEIRKHGQYYPACNGKCKPILAHMLQGVDMDDNPMLLNPALGKDLPIVMEDDYLLIVNKPAEFLSVPGKKIVDSVYTRMRTLYPTASGPLIVHRLDMSTSGLMLVAKSKQIHQALQSQFIKRKIKKRYVAILDGHISQDSGEINLPLRVDLDDRPRQLVCYEHGKSALTKWEVVERSENETRVHLYPVTGRTHQLRVHASHALGLHTAIKGDDLYGTREKRLYLHAEYLEFIHPVSKEVVTVEVKAAF